MSGFPANEMNKPIQHKMEYKGKKYVTEIDSLCCNGCAFIGKPCSDIVGRDKCLVSQNQDRLNRIWVEVKSDDKPKKDDHIWVVEYYDKYYGEEEKRWILFIADKTRKAARRIANHLRFKFKTRVRKFVPEK